MSKFIPRRMEFAVVSGGGVATTSILQHLQKRHAVNAPSDEDSLKHMPIPPVSFNPGFRYVFVFGDPVHMAISLFRRGYHTLQSRKLQRGNKAATPIPASMTLDEYAAAGEDRFSFERQFRNYYEHQLLYPTLFLRYDTLWENLESLRQFLDLDAAEMEGFPPRIARKSDDLNVRPHTLSNLEALYQPFQDWLRTLPDSFLRERTPTPRLLQLVLSPGCRLAIRNGTLSRMNIGGALYGE